MIKGVNLRTIEVRETGNRYFERAILFVDPAAGEPEEKKLQSEAEKFLSELEQPPCAAPNRMAQRRANRRNRRIRRLVAAVFWGLIGAGAVLLWQLIF